jgi:hypothetical protein
MEEGSVKSRLVGTYTLGYEGLELWGTDDTGGGFYFYQEKKLRPKIEVGLNYNYWADVLAVLLHEAQELAAARMGLRFERTHQMSNDMGSYVFIMSHVEFTEVVARAADLLSECEADLKTTWKQFWKERKAKK